MYNCKICSKNIDALYHFKECVLCPAKYHIKCLHTYKFDDTAKCLDCGQREMFYTERYNYIEYLFYYIYEQYIK